MKTFITSALLFFCVFAVKAQHTVVLKDGTKISCIVMGLENDMLSISVNRNLRVISMREVSSMFFDEFVAYDGKLVRDESEVKTIKSDQYLIKYVCKNREMLVPPKISNGSNEKGVVVVDIIVNQNGSVISANPGGVGSTTTSEYLYTKAKFAAQGAKFSPDTKGPVRTEGYIEISY